MPALLTALQESVMILKDKITYYFCCLIISQLEIETQKAFAKLRIPI